MQARLEASWDALEMPMAMRLELIDKYCATELSSEFPYAVDLW